MRIKNLISPCRMNCKRSLKRERERESLHHSHAQRSTIDTQSKQRTGIKPSIIHLITFFFCLCVCVCVLCVSDAIDSADVRAADQLYEAADILITPWEHKYTNGMHKAAALLEMN